jgi:hypothetical protein
MGQTFPFGNTGLSSAMDAQQATMPTSNDRVTRRQDAPEARVKVPALDWPSNLFSDNASMAEIMAEDLVSEWDMPELRHKSPEMCFQAVV